MITIKEGDVLFHFEDGCQVIKYDEDDLYAKNLKCINFKGVDFMINKSNGSLRMEIKDFRKDISKGNTKIVDFSGNLKRINQNLVKNLNNCGNLLQDIRNYNLELKPKKQNLVEEVAQKIRDTLSGLCLLKNYLQPIDFNKSPLYKYAIDLNSNIKIKVVLCLIWNDDLAQIHGDFEDLSISLEQKITPLVFPNIEIVVINQDTIKKLPISTRMGISFKIA